MVGGTHTQPGMTQAQLIAQRDIQKAAMDAAKMRSKNPTDKNIPEGIENLTVGDGVKHYKDLRELERRLDAVMMRKRLDLQDGRPQAHDRTRTMRVWISNTVENQPWQGKGLDENAFDFNTGMEGTYKVKIEGRLLDSQDWDVDVDQNNEDAQEDTVLEGQKQKGEEDQQNTTEMSFTNPGMPRPKMSHFFKSISVEYDRNKNLQSENGGYIEWKKPQVSQNAPTPIAADFDALEFERKSDENVNCTINLYRDENPERFELSKDLAAIIDMEEATRERIVSGIWEYARAIHLQQDEDKRLIQCDDRLRAVGGF